MEQDGNYKKIDKNDYVIKSQFDVIKAWQNN